MFPPSTRFLIVDDSMSMRKIVKKSLTDLGYSEFVEADNVRSALVALKVGLTEGPKIDFILSDVNMPQITGVEFLKLVKSQSEFNTLPFFLVTAEGDPEVQKVAQELGVSGYITKPFKAESFKAILEDFFKKNSTAA